MLAIDPADRELEILTDLLEVRTCADERDLDVHARTHRRAEVGRTGRDGPVLGVIRERKRRVDDLDHAGETIEDRADVATLLHRDDAELVFFVDPDERRLVGVVEDATSLRPVAVRTDGLEEAVSLLEEEVILNELDARLLGHALEGIELSGEIASELLLENGRDLVHEVETLFTSDQRSERIGGQVAAHTDARRDDGLPCRIDRFGRDLRHVEIRHVSTVETVVLLDERAEELGERVVGIRIAGVGADGGIGVLNRGTNGITEGEAAFRSTEQEIVKLLLRQCAEVLHGEGNLSLGHSSVAVGGRGLREH